MMNSLNWRSCLFVAPVRERGLKFAVGGGSFFAGGVAPVRERGLKYLNSEHIFGPVPVAPVRERGLK